MDVSIKEGGPTGGCEYKRGRTDSLITHTVIQYALLWGIIHLVDVSIKEGGATAYLKNECQFSDEHLAKLLNSMELLTN